MESGIFSKLINGSKIEELENEIASINLLLKKLNNTLFDNQIELPSSSIDIQSSLLKVYQNFISENYNWNLSENSRYEINDNSDKINIISNESNFSIRLNFGILNFKEIYFYYYRRKTPIPLG